MSKNLYRLSSFAAAVLFGTSLLAACAQPDGPNVTQATITAVTVPTIDPTVAATEAPTTVPPTATAIAWTFPARSTIAGIDVGGLTEEAATARVTKRLENSGSPHRAACATLPHIVAGK